MSGKMGTVLFFRKRLFTKNRTVPIFIFISVACLFFLSLFLHRAYTYRRGLNAWNELEQKITGQAGDFTGEAAIAVIDLRRNRRIVHNPHKFFPSASLVKIPIMVSCFYAAHEGRFGLDDKIRLAEKDKVSGSGMLKNARAGKRFTVGELIELMVAHSDNTATNILIDLLGFDYLNNSFKELGLKNTNISRKMMDFTSRNRGIENYTTAEDIYVILEKIYRRRLISRDIAEQCLDLLKNQRVRDRIPAHLPPETPVAHKTGLERGICHDAGIVFTERGDFIVCVLVRHQDKTARAAKNFIAQVALTVYNFYENG